MVSKKFKKMQMRKKRTNGKSKKNEGQFYFNNGFIVNNRRYPPLRFHQNLVPPPSIIDEISEINSMKRAIIFQYYLGQSGIFAERGVLSSFEALAALNEIARVRESGNHVLQWDPLNDIYFPTSENVFTPPNRKEKLTDEKAIIQIIKGTY